MKRKFSFEGYVVIDSGEMDKEGIKEAINEALYLDSCELDLDVEELTKGKDG